MDALDQSAELLRRSHELRLQSVRTCILAAQRCAAAAESVETSRLAAAAKTHVPAHDRPVAAAPPLRVSSQPASVT